MPCPTRRSLLAAGAGGALASFLGPLVGHRLGADEPLPWRRGSVPSDGYKALVCLFLPGGNDGFNMLVPTAASGGAGHATYAEARRHLAVANQDLGLGSIAGGSNLRQGLLGAGNANPYHVDGSAAAAYTKGLYGLQARTGAELGVNGVMPELAQLIDDGLASGVANVGALVRPTTRAEIEADTADLPVFLFSHNHQQRALQTGRADNLDDTGWAGRIADLWGAVNGDSPLGLNISYAGNKRLMIGDESIPLVLGSGAPPSFYGMRIDGGSWDADRRALHDALNGRPAASGALRFEADRVFTTGDPGTGLYLRQGLASRRVFDELRQAWNSLDFTFSRTGPYGEPLFEAPSEAQAGLGRPISSGLINQFAAVARMIHLAVNGAFGNGYHRQVFLVQLGGWDTHASQADNHPVLLRQVSLALWKFQMALEELGHSHRVCTFTMSDFGRTLTNNGDGTDHAWGGHHLVMSGDPGFQGGRVFGALPDLTLGRDGGTQDYSDKGRIIPSLAQDQLNAALCAWFGVSPGDMPAIFPNLAHFRSGAAIESAYLPLFAG